MPTVRCLTRNLTWASKAMMLQATILVIAAAVGASATCPSGEVCGRRPAVAAFASTPTKAFGMSSRNSEVALGSLMMAASSSSSSSSTPGGAVIVRGDQVSQRMLASDMCAPPQRRHLGPTTEDILMSRRAEKEKLRKNIAAMRAAANPDTDDEVAVDEEEAAPISFFTPGKGRHLGPSLDEIKKMRDEAFAARKAAKRPAATPVEDVAAAAAAAATTAATAEPGGSDEAELASRVGGADKPSFVQLKALDRYGVKRQDMPSTKAKATEMLRALREVDVANAMGCNLDKDDFRGGASREEAERVVQHYTPAPEGQDVVGADKHLDFAYRGISSIRRAGALRSIEA